MGLLNAVEPVSAGNDRDSRVFPQVILGQRIKPGHSSPELWKHHIGLRMRFTYVGIANALRDVSIDSNLLLNRLYGWNLW